MIAFVISGGGNRGALEAGALWELLEAGIKPDIIVGSSAGALNAAYLAADPTVEGARRLAEVCINAQKDDLFPGDWVSMVARVAKGQSLFPSDGLRRFLESQLPAGKRRFGDLQPVQLYLTASSLNTGRLYLWGEDPQASIVEAALASAAHPLLFPPMKYHAHQLVDGGVVANVPVRIAVEKGATEVYIVSVGYGDQIVPDQDHIVEILLRSITIMMRQHFLSDLKIVALQSQAKLHHISMMQFSETQLWDLSRSAEMVDLGRLEARKYLDNPTGLGDLEFATKGLTLRGGEAIAPPPGAREYMLQ